MTHTPRGAAWRRNTTKPRNTLRLSIYLRDHFACVYCGQAGAVDGLSIDHVDATVGNTPSNLVTSCFACNRLKQSFNEDIRILAQHIAPHCGRSVAVVLRAVAQQQAVPLTAHTRAVARALAAEKPDWLIAIKRLSDQCERKIPF